MYIGLCVIYVILLLHNAVRAGTELLVSSRENNGLYCIIYLLEKSENYVMLIIQLDAG